MKSSLWRVEVGVDLDATLDCPASTVQRSIRMPHIPARAQ
jgi:hypothetical protein